LCSDKFSLKNALAFSVHPDLLAEFSGAGEDCRGERESGGKGRVDRNM